MDRRQLRHLHWIESSDRSAVGLEICTIVLWGEVSRRNVPGVLNQANDFAKWDCSDVNLRERSARLGARFLLAHMAMERERMFPRSLRSILKVSALTSKRVFTTSLISSVKPS